MQRCRGVNQVQVCRSAGAQRCRAKAEVQVCRGAEVCGFEVVQSRFRCRCRCRCKQVQRRFKGAAVQRCRGDSEQVQSKGRGGAEEGVQMCRCADVQMCKGAATAAGVQRC